MNFKETIKEEIIKSLNYDKSNDEIKDIIDNHIDFIFKKYGSLIEIHEKILNDSSLINLLKEIIVKDIKEGE